MSNGWTVLPDEPKVDSTGWTVLPSEPKPAKTPAAAKPTVGPYASVADKAKELARRKARIEQQFEPKKPTLKGIVDRVKAEVAAGAAQMKAAHERAESLARTKGKPPIDVESLKAAGQSAMGMGQILASGATGIGREVIPYARDIGSEAGLPKPVLEMMDVFVQSALDVIVDPGTAVVALKGIKAVAKAGAAAKMARGIPTRQAVQEAVQEAVVASKTKPGSMTPGTFYQDIRQAVAPKKTAMPRYKRAETGEITGVNYVVEGSWKRDPQTGFIVGSDKGIHVLDQIAEDIPDTLERVHAVAKNPDPLVTILNENASRATLPIGGAADDAQKSGLHALATNILANQEELLISGIQDVKLTVKNIGRYVFAEMNNVVRRMGPDGEMLVRMADQVDEVWNRDSSGIINGIETAMKGMDKKMVIRKIMNAREGKRVALTSRELEVKKLVDHYLDNVALSKAAAVELPVDKLDNYWPYRVNWDKMHHKSAYDAYIAKMAKDHNMTPAQAHAHYTKYIEPQRTGRPFGNLERERIKGISEEFRKEPIQELYEYIRGVEKRIAEVRYFGGKNHEKAYELIQRIAEKGEDEKFVGTWLRLRGGDNPYDADHLFNQIVSSINDKQVAAKLPLAVISNSTQSLNNLLVTDTQSFIRGIRSIMNPLTREETLDFVRRSGIVMDDVFDELRRLEVGGQSSKWGEAVLRGTRFLGVERGNWILSAAIGRQWVQKLATNVSKNYRNLKRIGFLDEDIARIGSDGLTFEDEVKAARWLANKTQFARNPAAYSMFAATPMGRFFLLFKRFSIKQTQLLYDSVWTHGAKVGNFRPLVVAGTVLPFFGEGIAMTRGTIKEVIAHPIQAVRDPLSPIRTAFESRPQAPLARYLNALAWIGGIGITSEVIRALAAQPGQMDRAITAFMLGPTASEAIFGGVAAARTGKDILKAYQGEEPTWAGAREMYRIGTGALPLGQLLRPALLQFFQKPEPTPKPRKPGQAPPTKRGKRIRKPGEAP